MFSSTLLSSLAVAAALLLPTNALPTAFRPRSINKLSTNQFSAFAPFTEFARAAYCPTAKIMKWTCGGQFISTSHEES
jgi:hypothetical protein